MRATALAIDRLKLAQNNEHEVVKFTETENRVRCQGWERESGTEVGV